MATPKFDPNRVPDREFKAKPGEEVCDFCSTPHPQWVCPARGHTTGVVPIHLDGGPGQTVVQSPDDWAACDECLSLIVRGDRDGLAERSVKLFPASPLPMSIKRHAVRQAHDNFWAAREGEPFPISGHAFMVYAVPKDADDDMTEGKGILHRRFTGPSAADAEFAAQEWVDENESPDNPDRYEIREWSA
jgi:hypothetical protein